MQINSVEVLAHIRDGHLRALAVASGCRFQLLPNVPPAAEAGLPGYHASVWWGLVAPAETSVEDGLGEDQWVSACTLTTF